MAFYLVSNSVIYGMSSYRLWRFVISTWKRESLI